MAWIELHQSLWTHKKTIILSTILGIDELYAGAHMSKLWTWALDNAPDGDLTGLPDRVIAVGAGWKEDAETFVQATIDAGWIDRDDTSTIIHDWYDYAGRLLEKKEANKERMRNKRATHVQRTKGEHATHVQGLPNLTVPNHTKPIDNPDNNNAQAREDDFDHIVDTNELVQQEDKPSESAVTYLEKTWARPISGPECETVAKNIEQFNSLGCKDPDAMIIQAIKKADNLGKRNMRYIDSILFEWQKSNIVTLHQVQAEDEKFQQAKSKKNKASPGKQKAGNNSGKYDDIYL